jgi:hypothetical protein
MANHFLTMLYKKKYSFQDLEAKYSFQEDSKRPKYRNVKVK